MNNNFVSASRGSMTADLGEGIEVARLNEKGFESNCYELGIPQGRHLQSGHVALPHKAFYSLRLTNNNLNKCDVRIEIDGKEIGTWRIEGGATTELERPSNDLGRFTFYTIRSPEAAVANLIESEKLGLVSATFIPELSFKDGPPDIRFSKRQSFERGGTGLSGISRQNFVPAPSIIHNYDAAITIYARLVSYDFSPRPLKTLRQTVPSTLP